MESDFESTLHRISLIDTILNFSLAGWVFASAALFNKIPFPSGIFWIAIVALFLLFFKHRVKSKVEKMTEDMAQGMDEAVAPLNPKNPIPLTDTDFKLAIRFGKSIAYLGGSEEIGKILDDIWQSDDPSDIETYVSESDAREAIQKLEYDLTDFTLNNYDRVSHKELSHIVALLQNKERYVPGNSGGTWGEHGIDMIIELIQEAADIRGFDELEKIINGIDLKQYRP